jgi:uncharacterized membrane protein YGL010W
MIKNVQAYEKPSQYNHYHHDKKNRDGMMSTGSRVIIVIIAAQSYLLSRNSTIASEKTAIEETTFTSNFTPISRSRSKRELTLPAKNFTS